ncbi:MAG: hypothetical protein ACO1SV_17720 [Fimbriimonas sp.]
MITILASLCLSLPQEPPKWEEILSNIHRDIRTEKGVFEAWELKSISRFGEESEGKFRRWLDGKRYRQEIENDGTVQMAMASDGTKGWVLMRPAGFYVKNDAMKDPRLDKWAGIPKPENEEPSTNFGFKNAYDLEIGINPLPVVTKVEQIDGERRVHASVKTGDRTINLLLRFEPDKWLLKELDGKGSDGTSKISFKRVQSKRNENFDADRFAFDTKLAEGLEELTGENRERFIKSLQGDGR